jgi:Uma2 family endonuclease
MTPRAAATAYAEREGARRAVATATAPPAAAELRPHRFTVADYYRMAESGILTEDDRVELLGGQVVDMSPIGPPHASAVDACAEAFAALVVARRMTVRTQNPLALGQYDEPQPDVAVVRPRADRYATAHPDAADVLLLFEVAETSLARDQWATLAIYAAVGIREVWVLNLPEWVLEVYRDPAPAGYRDRRAHGRAAQVAPLAFPELALTVADLLPPGGPERERTPEAEATREHDRPRGSELER